MYVVAYETSSYIYHAKPSCYVCNRFLFSLSLEIEMAEKQDLLERRGLRKMGGENSPISPPLDPRLRYDFISPLTSNFTFNEDDMSKTRYTVLLHILHVQQPLSSSKIPLTQMFNCVNN